MRPILAVITMSLAFAAATAHSQQPNNGSRLEGRYWRAVELAGRPVAVQDPKQEPHLELRGGRITGGADGCNTVTGRYELKGDTIAFSQVIATQMACPGASGIANAFRAAIAGTPRWRVVGDRLEFFDSSGKRLGLFAARVDATVSSRDLQRNAWQLVAFRGSDGRTLTPDDGAKYTITFEPNGRLVARIDCNRGRGTWQSSGPNQVRVGPLALTRMSCPPGSMHDQIVKQFGNIRSFVVRDGHLFLSLMADGGIYEFQPIKQP